MNRHDKKLELLDIVTGTAVSERKITIYEFFADNSLTQYRLFIPFRENGLILTGKANIQTDVRLIL